MKISSKNHFSGISTFIEINEVLHPKRKKLVLFFLFVFVKNFGEKIFKKLSIGFEISSKNHFKGISTFMEIQVCTQKGT